MENAILNEITNIKATGVSKFPDKDESVGTFNAEIVGVEFPETQRFVDAEQKHYQWVLQLKAPNHGGAIVREWLNFNADTDESKQKSTAFFASKARRLSKLCDVELGETEMNVRQAIDAINALKGKVVSVNQRWNGVKFVQTYGKAQ